VANEIGFKAEDHKLKLQRKALKSAIEVAWVARNTTKGKEGRRALRIHMDDLYRLCNVAEFKESNLQQCLKEAGLDDVI
jgi:hypothetical protein